MSTSPSPAAPKIGLGSNVVVKLDHRFAKRGVLRAAIVNAVTKLPDGTRAYDLVWFLQNNDMASRHAPHSAVIHGVTEGTKEGQCQLAGSAWPTPAKVAAAAPKAPALPAPVPDAAKPSEEDPTVMVAPAPQVQPAADAPENNTQI